MPMLFLNVRPGTAGGRSSNLIFAFSPRQPPRAACIKVYDIFSTPHMFDNYSAQEPGAAKHHIFLCLTSPLLNSSYPHLLPYSSSLHNSNPRGYSLPPSSEIHLAIKKKKKTKNSRTAYIPLDARACNRQMHASVVRRGRRDAAAAAALLLFAYVLCALTRPRRVRARARSNERLELALAARRGIKGPAASCSLHFWR